MQNPNDLTSAGRMQDALASAKKLFFVLGFFSVGVNLLMLTGPVYMLQVYDRVLASGSTQTLTALTVLALGLFAGLGFLEFIRSAMFARIGGRLDTLLGPEVFRALRYRGLRDVSSRNDRELRDLSQVRQFVGSPALPAFFDAPFTPFFLLILFALHWTLGAIALAGALVLFALAVVNQAMNQKALQKASEMSNAASGIATQVTRNSEVVEALGMGDVMSRRWSQVAGEAGMATTKSSDRMGSFTSGIKAFRLFLQSAILGAGALLAIRGESSAGVMIAASILMGRAIAPIEQCVGQWRNVVGAREAYDRIKKLLGASPAYAAPMQLPAVEGALSVEAVFAGPPGSKKAVLQNVTFDLKPGEALGVIGPSASGKSTLARVLTGVWQPFSGAVRLDGAELSAWDRTLLGPQIGFMPQDVELFSGSVAANISRFQEEPDPAAIVAAARAAGAHDMIQRLEAGYETDIGVAGGYLSAGQRQRVGLARALYGDPAFVVLDEPNSNLDSAGDAALADAIKGLKARGATVVVIAHRPSAVARVDRLLVLEEGHVRLIGPRDEVLAKVMRGADDAPEVAPIRGRKK